MHLSSQQARSAIDGAREMTDRMIGIVPSDTGKFRNVVPKATEDMLEPQDNLAPPEPPTGHSATSRRSVTAMSSIEENRDASHQLASEWPMTRRDALQVAAGAAALAAVPLSSLQAASDSVANHTITLTVNGQPRSLSVDPRQSLLDVLREKLDLPGTKKGCNAGACGVCTILLNGKRVNACLTLAAMHDGAEITTIEGLAKGDTLHPLQAAFVEHEGFQCGYCTPGQIMSGVACIAEGHAGSPEEIKAWMSGNICRCGAYAGIVAAIAQAAKEVRP
jgi:xanthine dehydrogenase YagT iron-sulfur-binding subunit